MRLAKRTIGATCVMLAVIGSPVAAVALCEEISLKQLDRSPVDLVLSGDEKWLVTANQTSDSLSLVETSTGKLLHELPTGKHPTAITSSPDGRILVSCRDAGEVRVYRVKNEKLAEASRIHTGFHPHGLAVAEDNRTAYVALAAADQIAVLDIDAATIKKKIDVGRWPRYLALSPDNSRLAVTTAGDRGVTIVDTQARTELYRESFVAVSVGHIAITRDGEHAIFPWMVYRANPISVNNIKLGWVLASRLGRMRLGAQSRREAISTDPPGKAIADPFGIALTSDNSQIIVSASGTHELLLFKNDALAWRDRGGPDHIEPKLLEDKKLFDRIELGGRPMGLRLAKDDRTVFVANYLENSVQVVDVVDRKLVRTFALGGPEIPSLARRGEVIFHDARRSLDQWYSCATCHHDGGTSSVAMDTDNDGTAFTFKTVLPLYHVPETGPWTWHGWQKDLASAARRSITSTMQGNEPSDRDVAALVEYMRSHEAPPNPFRTASDSLSEAAARGKAIFEGKRAGCTNCHSGPRFTDGEVHDVGTGERGDRYVGFNTPSLVNVYHKVKLLHDGRASSLHEVLTGDHAPENVAGEKLSDDDVADLIAYLKSL